MIITITGKPCSGKGTVSKLICEKYNFEYYCTGDMMRSIAKEKGFNSVLDMQQSYPNMKELDNQIDSFTTELGKTSLDKNIVIDSRLAWHFIPNSFKVFVDVSINEAGARLLNANRANEKAKDLAEAKQILRDRWDTENARYQNTYGVDNLHMENYDLVISSDNKTPQHLAEEIIKAYGIFLKLKQ